MDLEARLINLATRPDRLEHATRELHRMGIPFKVFTAVKPTNNGGYATAGVRGCAESHLEILRQAVADGNSPRLIIEDDIRPCADFPAFYRQYNALIESAGGIADLIYYYNQHNKVEDQRLAITGQPTVGTHFYIARDPRRLLAVCDDRTPIDTLYYRAVENATLRVVSPSRQIVSQTVRLGSDVDLVPHYLQWKVAQFGRVYVDD